MSDSPDSWIGVWRMSGVDYFRALNKVLRLSALPVPVRYGRFTCLVKGGFLPNCGWNRRYMPQCVGNLNNQG